jgi:1,2-diacylglycerol 3-alpha-glucosyltransferase
MRILFVSDSYYPHVNGVYYFVCRMGPLLQEKGHQVAVIAPSVSLFSDKKKIDGLDVYGMASYSLFLYPSIRLPVPFGLKSRLRKIIHDFKPDVIHIQDHFFISKPVVELNRDLKIPLIATNHVMTENITLYLKGKRLKRIIGNYLWTRFSDVYNQANLVTTPSVTGLSIIRPKLDPQVEAVAISSGIDLERFNPNGDTRSIREKYSIPDKPLLLCVGRLDPEKRIGEILHAVALAVKKVDFCLVIVGKGTIGKKLEQLADELGISGNVIFTGFVPDEDLPYFYKLGRCFIIASTAELLSLVTLQAMASGMPVIAVNAGALVELVTNGVNGYLYEAGDIAAMVKCIENIIIQDDLYRGMSKKSLEFVQRHDLLKTVESFEKLYQKNITGTAG